MRDLKFAVRRLVASPVFTLFSVATLAIGIGVTTAVYSFLYALLWRVPAIPDPDAVVVISQRAGYQAYFSIPEFQDLADQQTTFASVAAWKTFGSALSARGRSRLVHGEGVSGQYFQVLGLRAIAGRTLLPSDDRPNAPSVALLSESVWRAQFDADPDVVGSVLRMGGRPYEVVGVMPADASRWQRRGRPAEVWVSIATMPRSGFELARDIAARNLRTLSVIARLRPGVTAATADTELAVIAARLEALSTLDTQLNQARRIKADPAFNAVTSPTEAEVGRLVLTLPVLVLLIACTNVANLVLSRGVSRRNEMAVRRAMGASRWQLIREQLVEGSVVACAGALGGILLTHALIASVQAAIEVSFGEWSELRVDARVEPAVLVAVAVAALLALIVSSLVPALQLTKTKNVRTALTSDTPAAALPRWRGRSNLIALQVAASVGLFLIAALFVRGIISLQVEESRLRLDRVALASVPFSLQQDDELTTRAKIDRVLTTLEATPGVEAVAVTSVIDALRGRGTLFDIVVNPLDKPYVPKLSEGVSVTTAVATRRLFEVLGRTVRYGRTFDDRDDAGAPLVAVVDESLAKKVTGTADAAGREVWIRRSWFDRAGAFIREPKIDRVTIAGVLADVPNNRGRDDDVLYLPFSQQFDPNVSILVQSDSTDVATLTNALRTAIREADPDVAIGYAGRADVVMRFGPAVILGLLTIGAFGLATVALVLSMAGLYGVLSHVVARRTRELGVRMALGAGAGSIVRLIMRDGLRPVLEGAFIGLGSAAMIRLWLQPYFSTMTVTAVDPLAFLIGLGPLVVAAAIACYVPARRAAKVDPNVALREL
jgi:putative ABC transport system permease protein